MWSYLKDKVYNQNPPTIEQLKDAVSAESRVIGIGVSVQVIEHLKKRV